MVNNPHIKWGSFSSPKKNLNNQGLVFCIAQILLAGIDDWMSLTQNIYIYIRKYIYSKYIYMFYLFFGSTHQNSGKILDFKDDSIYRK